MVAERERWKIFLTDFVLSKLVNKFQQIAFVLFLGTGLNKIPPLISFLGVILFLITYFSTYFYNDLMDLEDDKATKDNLSKVLLRGIISPREFIAIGFNLALIGGVLTTLWEPLLGVIAFLSVLLNNLRTHLKRSEVRQLLLVIVELLGFEGFWYALYGTLIPGILLPVILVYCSLYSALHTIYKEILRGRKDIRNLLRKPIVVTLLALSLTSSFLSLPALVKMPFHFVVLALGGIGYVSFIYFISLSKEVRTFKSLIIKSYVRSARRESSHPLFKLISPLNKLLLTITSGFMKMTKLRFSIAQVNNYSLFLLGMWLLASAIALNLIPKSYLKRITFTFRAPRGVYEIVKGIDNTQTALLSTPLIKEVRGLKDTIELKRTMRKRS